MHFCYHRKKGDGLWVPACVEQCSFGARIFRDLDNPEDPVCKLVGAGLAVLPRDEFGTKPKLSYVPGKGAYEIIMYPSRGEDQAISFTYWGRLKELLAKPLVESAMAAAVILGLAHIVRERRGRGREE